MKDLAVALENRPGALADLGDALGKAGVSVEGGGAWVANGEAKFFYSDHDDQPVLVVDDLEMAQKVSRERGANS